MAKYRCNRCGYIFFHVGTTIGWNKKYNCCPNCGNTTYTQINNEEENQNE